MNILALETSAKAASCAVYKEDSLFAESFSNAGLTHSQTIMPMLESMLSSSDMNVSDIDLFAVSAGPGSFTGLRIGIAAVKGMAMAQNKPCAAISTLEALAFNLSFFDGIIVPVMDARRRQVYSAIFKSGEAPSRLTDDEAVGIEDLYYRLKSYTDPVMLVGDGAKLCYDALKSNLRSLMLAPENLRNQRAASVCAAARRISRGGTPRDFGGAETLAAVYLRVPQAERERAENQEKKNSDILRKKGLGNG